MVIWEKAPRPVRASLRIIRDATSAATSFWGLSTMPQVRPLWPWSGACGTLLGAGRPPGRGANGGSAGIPCVPATSASAMAAVKRMLRGGHGEAGCAPWERQTPDPDLALPRVLTEQLCCAQRVVGWDLTALKWLAYVATHTRRGAAPRPLTRGPSTPAPA